MNKLLGIVAVLSFLGPSLNTMGSSATFILPTCLEDNYGNQYANLVADSVHGIITGTVINNQGCSTDTWSLIGSWSTNSGGQTILELSAGDSTTGSNCFPMYKLHGPYPYASWNYVSGYGAQPFRYAACTAGSAIVPNNELGGSRKPQ
jgi:hypothetical protein